MTVLAPKRSTETVRYTLNMARELQDDPIATYTLVVTSGSVTIPSGVPGQENIGTGVVCNIVGGTNGETNIITLTANTVAEQVIIKEWSLLVADGVSAVYPSTSTKRLILEQMFAAVGLSTYEFNPEPEEYVQALTQLDAMMAEFAVSSLDMGYAFPVTLGGGDLDDVSGVPDFCVTAVSLSLAQRYAPYIGKTLSPAMLTGLARAMIAVRAKLSVIPEYALPFRTPIGAGNKPWSTWYPWVGQFGATQ